MKKIILLTTLCFVMLDAKSTSPQTESSNIVWTVPEKKLPLPSAASAELQQVLAQIAPPNIKARSTFKSKSKQQWKDWVEYSQDSGEAGVKNWAKKYNVGIKQDTIAGVNVYYVIARDFVPKANKKLFIHLHGGAYIFGGGLSGVSEAILIARRTMLPVLVIDYRMPPDFPFPAAQEDVVRVYKELLKTYTPKSIAMGGSSSGGGLVLSAIQKLKALEVELPGALFVGTPWSDLSKTGDSLYVNEGIDRKIVTYDGFLPAAVKLYANGLDIKSPGLSPVYGDFSDFPPTMLVTGTRDLFLSMTVRVHRKMKAAGVVADLNVYEGLSHVEYFVVPDSPESKEVYKELGLFLKQNLK